MGDIEVSRTVHTIALVFQIFNKIPSPPQKNPYLNSLRPDGVLPTFEGLLDPQVLGAQVLDGVILPHLVDCLRPLELGAMLSTHFKKNVRYKYIASVSEQIPTYMFVDGHLAPILPNTIFQILNILVRFSYKYVLRFLQICEK
jgi:hypothetical protein